MRYYSWLLLTGVLILFSSCHEKKPLPKRNPLPAPVFRYQHNLSITDSAGLLPSFLWKDTAYYRPFRDSANEAYYAHTLAVAGEPALYYRYLGHPRYRLVWHNPSASDREVVVTLHRDRQHVWLTTATFIGGTTWNNDPTLRAVHHRRALSVKEWNVFEALQAPYSFRSTPEDEFSGFYDGPDWLLERHSPLGYDIMRASHGFTDGIFYLLILSQARYQSPYRNDRDTTMIRQRMQELGLGTL